ncbi:MAG: NUDIX domain-containing protein [Candidatus Bathyarchaeota archaeon]|nr:NUDIX domain-containing protein [Candidatus Bathyarchaeota archaeon]
MLKAARAVIFRDGKVLLGKRLKLDSFYGLWCTFGGGVEAGETPDEALKREIREKPDIEPINPELLTVTEPIVLDHIPETVQLHYFLIRDWKGRTPTRRCRRSS